MDLMSSVHVRNVKPRFVARPVTVDGGPTSDVGVIAAIATTPIGVGERSRSPI